MTSRYPAHWQWNPFAGAMLPPSFRKPMGIMRRPVAGGRWEVRKYPSFKAGPRKEWSAKTKGAASHLGRRFMTQLEAVAWAQKVATVYAMPKGDEKDEAYFQLRLEKYGDKHVIKGVFPDRPMRQRDTGRSWRP